ncbi:MAG: 5-oxoprolinase subunit PxpB [Blastocatellia bacterium]
MRIFPLGESALTIEFGNAICVDLNEKSLAVANYFESHPFHGFIEAVPAYSSTTVFYDLIAVRRSYPDFPSAFAAVKSIAKTSVAQLNDHSGAAGRAIEILFSIDDEYAPDLLESAKAAGFSPEEFIHIFTERTYRVYMLGFLPGFAYMGEVDERIAVPRKQTPRLIVPKGSVGIAGQQTGIYPLESPGGWQIIGRTKTELFMPECEQPCFFQPGDLVRFVAEL